MSENSQASISILKLSSVCRQARNRIRRAILRRPDRGLRAVAQGTSATSREAHRADPG
jgi:hypothetical protein